MRFKLQTVTISSAFYFQFKKCYFPVIPNVIIFILMCCRSTTRNDDGSVQKNMTLSQKAQRLRQKSRDKARKFKKRFSRYKPPEEESDVVEAPPVLEETAQI